MERDEALRRNDHYRCRLCGHISPLSATQCEKGSCRAQLSLYGEIITGEADTGSSGTKTSDGNQSGQGTTVAGSGPVNGSRCPYCGADVTAGTEECPRCGLRIAGSSSGRFTGEPGTGNLSDPPRGWKDKPDKAKKTASGWKVATIVTAIVSVVFIIILGTSLSDANREADRWRNGYNSLERDYNDLQDDYDAMRGIWELNNLGDLYTVKVTSVFNSDGDGKEIDKKLKAATMEHLAIGVKITAGADKNRWAENMTVKLTKSGSEIAFWTIKPNEHYDDGTKSCTWTMWTSKVETAGTYVAEFYHMGYLIARHEITVK